MEEAIAFSNVWTPTQGYRDHEESGKHDTTKGHSKLPITDPKEMEMHEFSRKKLKVIVLKVLRELQENTDKLFNETRK